MGAIFRKELLGYFTSPVGYIFLGVFFAVSGFFFVLRNGKQVCDENMRLEPRTFFGLSRDKRFLYIPEDISPEIKKRFPYYARIAPPKFYRLK